MTDVGEACVHHRMSTSGRVRVLQVVGRILSAVRDNWLAKPETRNLELVQLRRGKLRITFCEKTDSIIHPFDLIVLRGANHATLPNGTEQLIARAIRNRL